MFYLEDLVKDWEDQILNYRELSEDCTYKIEKDQDNPHLFYLYVEGERIGVLREYAKDKYVVEFSKS